LQQGEKPAGWGFDTGRAYLHFMAGSSKDKRAASSAKDTAAKRDADWTQGLKKLYDSVVDEPLPDAFRDLLSKLDSED
jgi:hypothetical protein